MSVFQRVAQVVTARPLGGSFFRDSPASVLTINDARIKFVVSKTLESEPNSASVHIFNLSESTRREFEARPLALRLFAGHDGSPKRIFSGDVFWATSGRKITEWETTVEAGDGQRSIRQARVNRSFKAGLKAQSALREIAQSMGLDAPGLGAQFFDLQKEFASGLVLSGPSRTELTRVLAKVGLKWSIQDGRLQILSRKGVATEAPVIVTQDTGLQGSPEFGAPRVEGETPSVKFRTLLKPELTAGRAVLITSLTAKGRYRVDSVRHVGDTHGSDWYSEVEARPV